MIYLNMLVFDFVPFCLFYSVNLQLLRQRYYYATWKADGTRYMMFITREGCYLIDRKFHFRRVQMRFPIKVCDVCTYMHIYTMYIVMFLHLTECSVSLHTVQKNALSETHHMTLLDGEMVIDVVPETQQRTRRYLIYDIMMLNQESLVQVHLIFV